MKKSTFLLFVFTLLLACSSSTKPTPTSVTPTEPGNPTLEPAAAPTPNDLPIGPTAAVLPASQPQLDGVTTDILNIRAGPGINYAVVGQLKQGESITIIGKSKDGLWWQFKRGWVSATYVQVSGDPTAIPVGTPSALPTP